MVVDSEVVAVLMDLAHQVAPDGHKADPQVDLVVPEVLLVQEASRRCQDRETLTTQPANDG